MPIANVSRLSVRLSLRVYRWWIVITQVGILFENNFTVWCSLSADPDLIIDQLQTEHPEILARIGVWYYGKSGFDWCQNQRPWLT